MDAQSSPLPDCPGCGFSYGWDGQTCRHCGYPVSPDGGLPKNRILYMSRHALAAGRTHRFQELTPEFQAEVRRVAGDRIRGEPVLAFIDGIQRWTLLTTREVICCEQSQLCMVRIADIPFIAERKKLPAVAINDKAPLEKMRPTYFRVQDRYGTETRIWAPGIIEAHALWVVLHSFNGKQQSESSGWL